jgi:hypothetical protein
MWIRIETGNPDPETGRQNSTKKRKSEEISCFDVLDVLFEGLEASTSG